MLKLIQKILHINTPKLPRRINGKLFNVSHTAIITLLTTLNKLFGLNDNNITPIHLDIHTLLFII